MRLEIGPHLHSWNMAPSRFISSPYCRGDADDIEHSRTGAAVAGLDLSELPVFWNLWMYLGYSIQQAKIRMCLFFVQII